MFLASTLLSPGRAYRGFQQLVGASQLFRSYLRDYVRVRAGDHVLDLGCGTGDILTAMPGVHYVGLDLSAEYIRHARARYGPPAEFVCQAIEDYTPARPESFDVVMANGVLHHLDDAQAAALFRVARAALKPGGRFVSFDGCFVPGQSRFARWMLQNDRGEYVRRREEYVRLAAATFPRVEAHVRHDLLRVPYTHLIMVCSAEPAPAESQAG